jgi:hypothetical protein
MIQRYVTDFTALEMSFAIMWFGHLEISFTASMPRAIFRPNDEMIEGAIVSLSEP